MKITHCSILLAAVLATFLFLDSNCAKGADLAPAVAPAVAVPAAAISASTVAFSQRYRAGEVNFSTSYGVSYQSIRGGTSHGFVAVGTDYWITRGFGLGLRGQIDDLSGAALDRFGPRVTVRAPLWDKIAPYGYGEAAYALAEKRWHAGIGAGLEYRIAKNFGVFAEAGTDVLMDGRSTVRASGGVRVIF